MRNSSTPLADLLVSRLAAVRVKRAESTLPLASMIRLRLVKSAQLGEAGKGKQHRFESSIADMNASRANALAVDQANAARGMRGMTGDKYYDSLPDVAERRGYENAKADYENWLKHRDDIVQQQNIADIKKKMDEEGPTKSWGDTTTGRTLAGIIAAPFHGLATVAGSLGLGVNNWMEGRGFMEGQKDYFKTQRESFGDVAHDTANNFQLQANAARHGAGTVARAANHYLRPSTWKSDSESVAQAQARKNEWHNADLEHHERASRIFDNFTDSTLKDDKSTLGLLNYGLNTAVGEFAGSEAATMGIGGASKGIGKGINSVTRAASNTVRGGSAAGAAAGAASNAARGARAAAGAGARSASNAAIGARAAADAGMGAKAVQFARNTAARGIDAVGDTIAMPFNAVGTMATPITTTGKAVTQFGRDAAQTAKNLARPVRDLRSILRNPQQYAREFSRHPWTRSWTAATYPVRWAWNTGKPLGRHLFSDPVFKGYAAAQAYGNASDGNYGGAVSPLTDMAAYGMLGGLYMPYSLGRDFIWGGGEE